VPFCPRCREEYNADTRECPECREPLVRSLPRDPNQGELFQTAEICKVPDEVTGMALHAFLIDAGCQASLVDLHGSFYGSVLSNLQGFWGEIIVPQDEAEKARKLVDKFWQDFNQGR